VLFVFVVLAHDRRRIVHLSVTAHPTAAWTAQQLREAWPWDTAPRFVIRDRDGIYGSDFERVTQAMGHRRTAHGTSIALAESVR
jgi:putative transposase